MVRNREASAAARFASMLVRIFSIISGPSMQAMILTDTQQAGQVSMSMPNTRLKRCAQAANVRYWRDVNALNYAARLPSCGRSRK